MAGNSLIPDFVGETLGDAFKIYKQVEETKLTIQLAKAQASLASLEAANKYRDAQAANQKLNETPQNSGGFELSGNGLLLALGVGAVALYLILK